jgi:hypothetical protein
MEDRPGHYCKFFEGMFSNEPHLESENGKIGELFLEPAATGMHEAGHAVVGYALGWGCSFVSINLEYAESENCGLGVAYGGMAKHAKQDRRAMPQIRRGYGPAMLTNGILTCAGPAAERKYRFLNGLPLRSLDTAGGDYAAVDGLARMLEQQGRSRGGYALKRLVWRLAQRAVDNEAIWAAISEIGEELAWRITDVEAERGDDPKIGDRTETKMGGHQARAIMRGAGVAPGMLGVRLG